MSTIDDVDDLARRAAAALSADAPDAAETEAALTAVKRGRPSVVPMTPRVTRYRSRAGGRSVVAAGVAASVIALGIVGLVAVTRSDSSPSAPVPTAVPVTPVVPTVPPTWIEPQPGPFTLTVTPGATGPREILYAASVGSDDDQLGAQQCDDCESERPHDPIITDDGRVVVFDMANHRWVVVDQGPVPIDPSLDLFELQLGRDGLIYTSAKVDEEATWSIVVWDPADLSSPVETIPTGNDGDSLALLAYDDGVRYSDGTLAYIGPAITRLGTLTWDPSGELPSLTRTYPQGGTTTWTLPATWDVQLPAGMLPDGSAMIGVFADDGLHLVRLFPDGTSLAMRPVQGDGVWAAPSYTLAGVSVVQRTENGFEIARYPLPQHPGPSIAPGPETTVSVPTETTYAGNVPPPGSPIIVSDAVDPLPTGEVLYRASSGAGADQLGLEPCQECDPLRPLTPVVTAEGTVLIVDPVNSRIVSVVDGVPTTWPLPDDFRAEVVAFGADSHLYIGGAYSAGTTDTRSALIAYEAHDLARPVREIETDPLGSIRATPTGLAVDEGAQPDIAYIGEVRVVPPRVETYSTGEGGRVSAQVLVVDQGGSTTTWQLPEAWAPGDWSAPIGATAAVAEAVNAAGEPVALRLGPDRSSAVMPMPSSHSYDESLFADERGVVALERTDNGFDVTRYPLPG